MPVRRITLDGNQYAVDFPWVEEIDQSFPQAQTTAGQRDAAAFGLHQRVSIEGPFGIGQRQGNDPSRGFSQANVIAWYPGQITRSAQELTPTWTGPSTFTAAGFGEGLDTVWLYGAGGTADDEPLHYYVGATETWTDATLNADLNGDFRDIVAILERNPSAGTREIWAINRTVVVSGGDDTLFLKSTDKTTWTRTRDAGFTENFANAIDEISFAIVATTTLPTTIYFFVYDSTNDRSGVTAVGTSVLDSATTSVGLNALNITGRPRGLVAFYDEAGLGQAFPSNKHSLFMGTGAEWLFDFNNPGGSYTGTTLVHGDRVYFLDGEEVGFFQWTGSGRGDFKVTYISPPKTFPANQAGDWNGIAVSRKDFRWMIFSKGGDNSGEKASIFMYDTEANEWYCPYQTGTAQRRIAAMTETVEDDGNLRLHICLEQASGGDQDPTYFEKFLNNPLEETSYKYSGTTGTIVDSERDDNFPFLKKGYMAAQLDADSLSANETVTIYHAHDGGADDAGQAITSSTSPPQVWAGGSANTGKLARRQRVTVQLDGTAGNTEGPNIKSVVRTYNIPPQKADGTPPKRFGLRFRFEDNLNQATGGGSVALNNLYTTLAKGIPVTFIPDDQTTLYVILDPNRMPSIEYNPGEDFTIGHRAVDGSGIVWLKETI